METSGRANDAAVRVPDESGRRRGRRRVDGRGEDVDPEKHFFRTVMRFETGAPYLAGLNRTIAVATAERKARQILLSAYRLL